ncbi:MAG: hypothetical protein ACJ8E4_05045 [Sphingomicrobium sp.]
MDKSPEQSALSIRRNKNRLKQATRTGGRKLFDADRKAIFLEWFAATCNVKLSAEQADICYHSAFRHRREDSAFAEAWDAALAQGYAALEAGLLADAIAPDTDAGPVGGETEGEPPPATSPLSFEQRMVLLKEYRRRDGGHGPRPVGKPPTIQPRIASEAEAEAELIKRLKMFALRVAEADAEGRSILDEPVTCSRSGVPITGAGGQQDA